MPSTYTLIKGDILASDTASYTFSAIPSTYTDLSLRISARDNFGGNVFTFTLRFNGDTSAVYSNTRLEAKNTTSAGSARTSSATSLVQGYYPTPNQTADTFGSAEFYIPNYASTTFNKPILVASASEDNSTTSNYWAERIDAGLYSSTTAISSILILAASTFLTGSSFYLYGIKNS